MLQLCALWTHLHAGRGKANQTVTIYHECESLSELSTFALFSLILFFTTRQHFFNYAGTVGQFKVEPVRS